MDAREQILWEKEGQGNNTKEKRKEGEEDDIGWTSFTETRTAPIHLHMAHYLVFDDFLL